MEYGTPEASLSAASPYLNQLVKVGLIAGYTVSHSANGPRLTVQNVSAQGTTDEPPFTRDAGLQP